MFFKDTCQITEYRFLKVKYESKVTWRVAEDYLRCTPHFGNSQEPRHDCVMVRTAEKVIFASLIFLFAYEIGDQQHLFALVHAYDAPTGLLRQKEKDLGLIRLCAKHRKEAEFIPIQSIIRGAYIVPEFDHVDEYHVVDSNDGDIFLRLQEMDSFLAP